jgi:hypothetical protein
MELRENFTPSERVAIMETINREQRGGNQAYSADRPNKSSGLGIG